ncbi:MAG TPA: hypothetical protein V6D17_17450, partial [Candidatus Obscuribacterales bacterium]
MSESDAYYARQLASQIENAYRENPTNFHNQLLSILTGPDAANNYFNNPNIQRMALAQLEQSGTLPSLIVTEFGNDKAMSNYGHGYFNVGEALLGRSFAGPGTARYFSVEDFQALARGQNPRGWNAAPDAATAFLAGAVLSRFDTIKGSYGEQHSSNSINTLFEDSNSAGITIGDIITWGGATTWDSGHDALVAQLRPQVENAVTLASDSNSSNSLLRNIANNQPVSRDQLYQLIHDQNAFSQLTASQRNAVQYLYDHYPKIVGMDTPPASGITKSLLERYADVMGTSLMVARQNTTDRAAVGLNSDAVSAPVNDATSQMPRADAQNALTILTDARFSQYTTTEPGTNAPVITRANFNALLNDPRLLPAERDMLNRVPF